MEENTMGRGDAEETVSVPDIREGETFDGSGRETGKQESPIDSSRMDEGSEGRTATEVREGSRRVSRSESEERTGSRRVSRSGAEERTGSRSGAEERTGSRRVSRSEAEERAGSRRVSRSEAEERTGSRRVSRSEAEERTVGRRVSRSEAEERAGSRRVSRNGAEERVENRRASRSGVEERTGSRRVSRSEAEERTGSRRVSRSEAEERTGSRRADSGNIADMEQFAGVHENRSTSERTESTASAKAESREKDHETTSGKFGLGHQKTRRSAIVYLFEDIGDAFVRAKNWCVKNYRTSIPAAICLVLVIVVACILVRNFRQQPAPASDNMDDMAEEYPLEKDAYEHVNLFFQKYYEASTYGDVDTYMSMRSYTDETECIRMQKKANYIDYYQNLSCYTKPGLVENTYLVYVYYEVKFRGINTLAPGLKTFYVCTNDEGELYIYSDEVDQNVEDYMRTVSLQEDVKDLFTRVKVTYKNAVASDKNLEDFLAALSENLKDEVTKALLELEEQNQIADNSSGNETQEGTEPVPEEPAPEESEPATEPQTDTVMTTDRVNVRSSASPEATKLGTVASGTQFTRYESLENGWSKIDYEGSEAYIKTEYLQVIEAATGKVRTIDSVNIRASASEDATKLGTVSAGTTLDLIEDQENGWSRILFDGSTAYVKTEYLEHTE